MATKALPAVTALVTVLLVDALQSGRAFLPPGSLQQLPPDEAERLIGLGAARIPPSAPTVVAAAEDRTVSALSDVGTKFLRATNVKRAADFALELRSPADLAEVTALEYRREGGARAEVLEALRLASDEARKAADAGTG